MAAANTDKFKKAKRRFSTTIGTGGFAQGATTLPLSSTTGLDTDTAITLVLEPGTNSEEVITGVVSGSNIINCVRAQEGTTDVSHNAGAAVSMYFTETHWDDLINGILVSHKQDGTQANNSVTAASITDGAITPAKLGTGTSWAWQNWTVTLTNVTKGNGTETAKYIQIGKTVHFFYKFILGNTSSVSGLIGISLPVTAKNTYGQNDSILANVKLRDASPYANYFGVAQIPTGSNRIDLFTYTVSGSYLITASTSSTVPFTWTTSDIILVTGTYEAA